MLNFKNYILLKEITEKTILYHRSLENFEPGQILSPKEKYSKGHHYEKDYLEIKLEEYRQENTPENLVE